MQAKDLGLQVHDALVQEIFLESSFMLLRGTSSILNPNRDIRYSVIVNDLKTE